MHDIVMHFKSLKEFLKNFFFSLLSTFNFRMLASIILAFNVSNSKDAITVVINLLESFSDKLSSELVHGTNYNSNEFIKVDVTVTVEIKGFE